MLGHTIAGARSARGDGAAHEEVSQYLQEGLTAFLKQTAFPNKEVNAWKDL